MLHATSNVATAPHHPAFTPACVPMCAHSLDLPDAFDRPCTLLSTPSPQINAGQVEQAETLLDGVLASAPTDLSALVARGTARALRRRLREAVADFTAAIEVEPR